MNPYLYQSGIGYGTSGIIVLILIWLMAVPFKRLGVYLLEHKFWGKKRPEIKQEEDPAEIQEWVNPLKKKIS